MEYVEEHVPGTVLLLGPGGPSHICVVGTVVESVLRTEMENFESQEEESLTDILYLLCRCKYTDPDGTTVLGLGWQEVSVRPSW